jgi:hypothetical protein
MNVIELIKKQLEPLLNNTYVTTEKQAVSNLQYIIIESLLKLNNIDNLKITGKNNIRSFQDIEIINGDELYKIDINMHDVKKVISLPSLMSIKRAKDFLSNSNNYITYIFVDYFITNIENENQIMMIKKISVQNIESLDWSYLSIQNLGKGQLQMKNISTELTFNNDITRKEWLAILKRKGSIYYENLLLKIIEYKSKWEENN